MAAIFISPPSRARGSCWSEKVMVMRPPGVYSSSSSSSSCIRCRFTTPRRASTYSSPTDLKLVSVPVRVAQELLQAGHFYLDVRSREEFSAGAVDGAINVPYLLTLASGTGIGMAMNPNFMAQVSTHFDKDDEILIGCQSGKRSQMAANHLISAGYTGIMDVAGGYDAWIQTQLHC